VRYLVYALLVLAALGVDRPVEAQVRSAGPYGGQTSTDYVIQPGDVLQVRVWPDTSLSGEFPIEETGYAYLPVVGRIEAGGQNLADIRASLRTAYAREMTMPVVTVTPIFRVSVLGAVRAPGLYRVDPTMTLFDAISMAGGFLENADPGRLRILRDGRVIEVNAQAALETGGPIGGVDLHSGDRVVVPEERWTFLTWDNVWRMVQVAISVVTLAEVLGSNQ
jgi:protein involved in polysaccharide export with SLBB domain